MDPEKCVIWKLSFKITPLPNHDEDIDGIKFKKGSNIAEAVIIKKLSEYKRKNDHYLLQSPKHEYTKKIENLLLIKAIHNCIFEPIEVYAEGDGDVCNEDYFKELGINFRLSVKAWQDGGYHLYEENDFFSDAIKYWDTGFQ